SSPTTWARPAYWPTASACSTQGGWSSGARRPRWPHPPIPTCGGCSMRFQRYLGARRFKISAPPTRATEGLDTTGAEPLLGSHVPTPPANRLTFVNPGLSGFLGVTHRDQRFAGTGAYANTQFNLEPPDQGLCVGGGFVLELVNTALAVYSTNGARLAGPTPIN